MKIVKELLGKDALEGEGVGWCCGADKSQGIRSNLQRRGHGGHCGRAACFWRQVWPFVQGRPGVRREEKRCGVVMRRRSDAEWGSGGRTREVEVVAEDCASVTWKFRAGVGQDELHCGTARVLEVGLEVVVTVWERKRILDRSWEVAEEGEAVRDTG